MTREEAINVLVESKRQNEVTRDNPNTFFKTKDIEVGQKAAQRRIDALDIAISALRAQQEAEKNEPLRCTGCFYLEENCAPCTHCIRAAGYADYYRRKPEEGTI